MVVSMIFISIMIVAQVLCKKRHNARNRERLELTGSLFITICLTLTGLTIAFPLTNIWIGVPAAGWKYQWMERFKGASKESFVATFGQPAADDDQFLRYGQTPWFSYPLPDDHLDIAVENGRIKAFIWH
jgi:hypothetical protein